jgi:hypothetical protein
LKHDTITIVLTLSQSSNEVEGDLPKAHNAEIEHLREELRIRNRQIALLKDEQLAEQERKIQTLERKNEDLLRVVVDVLSAKENKITATRI